VPPRDRTATLVLSILWMVLAGLMVRAATSPFHFTDDEQIVLTKIAHVSPDPLVDTWARTPQWVSASSVALDVMFFLPFGIMGGLVQRYGSSQPRARRLLLVTLIGFLLSVSIETLQVFTRDRIPSSADVVANTLGTSLGAWAALRRIR
jgi:VanZ family protein